MVAKNDEIEIGRTLSKEGSSLKIVFYITPQKQISVFDTYISQTRGINTVIFPIEQNKLQKGKQYRMYVMAEMEKYVFPLPKIKFSYRVIENGK